MMRPSVHCTGGFFSLLYIIMKFNYCHWPKVLDKDEIKKVVNICETNVNPIGDKRYAPKDGEEPVIKTAKVTCTRWKYLNEILNSIYENWLIANQNYFGFNLYSVHNECLVNYNIYDSFDSSEYDFHTDAAMEENIDIKLTAIINLSEEYYEGGDFILFHGGKFREISEISSPGDSLIFKSWIPHKVTPVTKGIRKTLSLWFIGPKFI